MFTCKYLITYEIILNKKNFHTRKLKKVTYIFYSKIKFIILMINAI